MKNLKTLSVNEPCEIVVTASAGLKSSINEKLLEGGFKFRSERSKSAPMMTDFFIEAEMLMTKIAVLQLIQSA